MKTLATVVLLTLSTTTLAFVSTSPERDTTTTTTTALQLLKVGDNAEYDRSPTGQASGFSPADVIARCQIGVDEQQQRAQAHRPHGPTRQVDSPVIHSYYALQSQLVQRHPDLLHPQYHQRVSMAEHSTPSYAVGAYQNLLRQASQRTLAPELLHPVEHQAYAEMAAHWSAPQDEGAFHPGQQVDATTTEDNHNYDNDDYDYGYLTNNDWMQDAIDIDIPMPDLIHNVVDETQPVVAAAVSYLDQLVTASSTLTSSGMETATVEISYLEGLSSSTASARSENYMP